ncbi:MAG: hypothetical protein KKH83_07470 [Candidatus Margulisbacteria bacterium]|nr:hypothetical protein [Candidatus Margulisiibacteriota bacterium]
MSIKISRYKPTNGPNALNNDMRRINHFIPGLLTTIRQSFFQVKLCFKNDGLTVTSEILDRDLIDGKHIAKTFLRAGIKAIIIKEFPSGQEVLSLEKILEHAQNGEITPLVGLVPGQPEIISEIERTSDQEAAHIPGHFKHYTSAAKYSSIMQAGRISAQPHKKNGQVREGVYLTGLSLPPREVEDILFIGNASYRDHGTHVIGFDVVDEGLRGQIRANGIEHFLEDAIDFSDPRIKVRYFGPNTIKEAA